MSETSPQSKCAVVTGASAGIGAATARALATAGFDLVLGARRIEVIETLAAEIAQQTGRRATARALDVTDPERVEHFCQGLDRVDLLVNNAGFAWRLEQIDEATDEVWRAMYETNVLGVMRMTRTLLPALRSAAKSLPDPSNSNSDSDSDSAEGTSQIINVGSISGFEVYSGGSGYTASKHALRALTKTLRIELLGEPIQVTEIAPGLAETEFSQVRFDGDLDRAKSVYDGMTPLVGEDVAQCIVFAATRPPHVNIDEIVVRPRDQATSTQVFRRT